MQAGEDLRLAVQPMLEIRLEKRLGIADRCAMGRIKHAVVARDQLAQARHVGRHVAVGGATTSHPFRQNVNGTLEPIQSPRGWLRNFGNVGMSESVERTHQYRMAAEKLRRTAEAATLPEVRSELLWLASSYERLASDHTHDRIEDGIRSLEIRQGAPTKAAP